MLETSADEKPSPDSVPAVQPIEPAPLESPAAAPAPQPVIEPPKPPTPAPKPPTREESLQKIESLGQPKITIEAIFAILIAVIFLGLTGVFYFVKVTKSSLLKAQNAKYEDLQTQLKTGDLKDIDKNIVDLQGQIEAFKKARSGQLLWSNLAKELPAVTEKQVQLTNFSVDDKNNVKIDGKTKTYVDLAKLILGVDSSSKFSQVKLTSVAVVDSEEGKYIHFSLTAFFEPKSIQANAETTPQTQVPVAPSQVPVNQGGNQ